MKKINKNKSINLNFLKILLGCLLPLSNFFLLNFRYVEKSVLYNFYLGSILFFILLIFLNLYGHKFFHKINVINLFLFNYIYAFLYSDFFKDKIFLYFTIQLIVSICIVKINTNQKFEYFLISLFLVFNSINYLEFFIENTNKNDATISQNIDLTTSEIELNTSPDIYVVVMDGYINQNLQNKYLNSSNELIKFLDDKNFFIAEYGKTFSNMTRWSMSSLLSFNNSEKILEKSFPERDVEGNSLVHSILLSNNYQFLTARSAFGNFCDKSLISDLETCVYAEQTNYITKRALVDTTILGYFQDINFLFFDKLIDYYYNQSNLGSKGFKTKDITTSIESLEKEKPLFSFIHMTYTHPPYTLDSECDLKINWTDYKQENWNDLTAYGEALNCTNKMVYELIDFVNNKKDAIIVITSDHGPVFDLDNNENFTNKDEKNLATTIFFSTNLNKYCEVALNSNYYLQNFFIDFFNCFSNTQIEPVDEIVYFYDVNSDSFEKINY